MTITFTYFLVASIITAIVASAWCMQGIYRGRAFLLALVSLLLFDRAIHTYNLKTLGFDPMSEYVRTWCDDLGSSWHR